MNGESDKKDKNWQTITINVFKVTGSVVGTIFMGILKFAWAIVESFGKGFDDNEKRRRKKRN